MLWTATAGAIEGDEQWSQAFALPGTDGKVYTTTECGGDLIVAGDFLHVGIQTASRIALWDGSDWHAMGEGFDAPVRALVEFNGILIAGGDFGHSGQTPMQAIARWDGTAWQPLWAPLDWHSVHSLAIHDGHLYAGGIADAVVMYEENLELAGLARWDGSEWSELAEFEYEGTPCCVEAITPWEGELVVAGSFDTLDWEWDFGGIARWDGTWWSDMGTLRSASAMLIHESQLYLASAQRLYRWQDPDWVLVSGALNYPIHALGEHDGMIIAAGAFSAADGVPINCVAAWDGVGWSGIGETFDLGGMDYWTPAVYALGSYGGLLIAGGSFTQVGARGIRHLVAWDGGSWQPLDGPGYAEFYHGPDWHPYALAAYGGDVAMGGRFEFAYDVELNGIGIWDGGAWQGLGSGLDSVEDYVGGLTEYQGDLVACGSLSSIGGVAVTNLAIWNGAEWIPCGDGQAPATSVLLGVGSDLYLGGGFVAADGYPGNRVAKWDGSAWSDLDGGLNGWVDALCLFDGCVVAAGSFTADAHGAPLGRIARWDGVSWQPIGQGFDEQANALVVWNGQLVAGGNFTTADDQPAPHLAVWDGQHWVPFGDGPNARVRALAAFDDDLIIGGSFTAVGALPTNSIARWDGLNWSALGSGLTFPDQATLSVYDLVAVGGRLYCGGNFLNAGGKASFGIACWSEPPTSVAEDEAPMASLGVWNHPNPFNPRTEIVFNLARPASVTLQVLDANGRCVRSLIDEVPRAAGEHRLAWDGDNDAGRRLASGVYLLRLEAGGRVEQSKLVLLK